MQDSSINTDQNKNMNDELKKDSKENLQECFEQLQSSFEQISSQLITIRDNIQKRKRETTALRILLYTGLFLLLIGFIYSNTTLQRVQLKNLQSDFRALTHQTNQDLTMAQGIVLNEIQRMKNLLARTSMEEPNEKTLHDALASISKVILQIQPAGTQTKELIKQFSQKSNDLLLSYVNYKKSLSVQSLSDKKAQK